MDEFTIEGMTPQETEAIKELVSVIEQATGPITSVHVARTPQTEHHLRDMAENTKEQDSLDWCERCYQHFPLSQLTCFEYGQEMRSTLSVILCFPCLKLLLEALMSVPLERRMELFRTLYAAWWEAIGKQKVEMEEE